jgi:hypothetical protein
MSMWRWRRLRRVTIPPEERDIFERYGENVIGSVLAGGFNPATAELQGLYRSAEMKDRAADWLSERADARERREDRLETLEWAILLFVFLEVVYDLAHWLHCP